MGSEQTDRDAMVERHKLVVSIIDVNSRQLRCDSAKAGLDIERACAVRDMASAGPEHAEAAKARLQEIELRIAAVAEEHNKLATEREFLDSALTEFDAAAPKSSASGPSTPRSDDRVGRA